MICKKCGKEKASMWTGLCDDCTAFQEQFTTIWTELRTDYPELLCVEKKEES